MQDYYIGDGKINCGGHIREATREELIGFLNDASENRTADNAVYAAHVLKLNKANDDLKTLAEKYKDFFNRYNGADASSIPSTLSLNYKGNGYIEAGTELIKMSPSFLMQFLELTLKLYSNQTQELKHTLDELKQTKKELANTFSKLVDADETQCRALEVCLSTEKKTDNDFLIAVVEFPLEAPNEIGWSYKCKGQPRILVGVALDDDAWSFTRLTTYEKQAIGRQFEIDRLQLNKYYWCGLSYDPSSVKPS